MNLIEVPNQGNNAIVQQLLIADSKQLLIADSKQLHCSNEKSTSMDSVIERIESEKIGNMRTAERLNSDAMTAEPITTEEFCVRGKRMQLP